jgi:phosphodiesterase/alkaline phosphatase D-like protein
MKANTRTAWRAVRRRNRWRDAKVLVAVLACAIVLPALRSAAPSLSAPADAGLTHGPLLGQLTSNSIRVWARTARSGTFRVRFSEEAGLSAASTSAAAQTALERDNTGWVELRGLRPDTKYYYALEIGERLVDTRIGGRFNSFRTLPDAESVRHPQRNPRGLFNFSFEVGSCTWQYINSSEPDHEKA